MKRKVDLRLPPGLTLAPLCGHPKMLQSVHFSTACSKKTQNTKDSEFE
jgi:hypothetical protein